MQGVTAKAGDYIEWPVVGGIDCQYAMPVLDGGDSSYGAIMLSKVPYHSPIIDGQTLRQKYQQAETNRHLQYES